MKKYLQILGFCKEIGGIVFGIAVVLVQGDIVHILIGFL